MTTSTPARVAALLVAAALAVGCAVTGPARMLLPEALDRASALPFEGLGDGRQGDFLLDGHRVSFERGADRLSLFGVFDSDKTMLAFTIDGSVDTRARCDGRALQGTLGVLDGALRPFALRCRLEGAAPGQLDLAAAGTIGRREGRLQAGGVTLEIRSLHALKDSAFQLAHPAGYELLHEGRAVAAIDLGERTPHLHRADTSPAVQRAALLGAVALGLLWDPAARAP